MISSARRNIRYCQGLNFQEKCFPVENDETQSNNDNDGKGSASHDQCKRAILKYGDDDDSTMVVDEDQEDSFFQLNIM